MPYGTKKTDARFDSDITPDETSWKMVPESWPEILRLKDTYEYKFDDVTGVGEWVRVPAEPPTFLSFEAFSPPEIAYLAKIISGGTPYRFGGVSPIKNGKWRFLYPHTQISERVSHTYNADSSTYASAINQMWDKTTSMVAALTQLKGDSTEGAVYDAPVLWASTERREINITLSLFAFTDLEKDIYGPIRFFRNNSYPTQKQGAVEKRLNVVRYPAIFRITGGAFETFNANSGLNYYNLVNMSVEYSDSVKFMSGGVPMNAKVNLTFVECLKMYSNLLDKREAIVSISTTANRFTEPSKGEFKPGIEDVNNNTVGARVAAFAKNAVKSTAAYRLVNNIRERAINEAIGFVLRKIQGSSAYKRLDDIVNIDLMHRIEMRKYTHAGFKRSDTIELAHAIEVRDILRKVRP